MRAHHLTPSGWTGRHARGRYLAGAGGIAVPLGLVAATLAGRGAPTRIRIDPAPRADAPTSASPSTVAPPGASAVATTSGPSDAIDVVRSGRQALALPHGQPELMGLPQANVVVIGAGANAATAWREIEAARESLGDGTAPAIDLR
jgi:hypothetical protein